MTRCEIILAAVCIPLLILAVSAFYVVSVFSKTGKETDDERNM